MDLPIYIRIGFPDEGVAAVGIWRETLGEDLTGGGAEGVAPLLLNAVHCVEAAALLFGEGLEVGGLHAVEGTAVRVMDAVAWDTVEAPALEEPEMARAGGREKSGHTAFGHTESGNGVAQHGGVDGFAEEESQPFGVTRTAGEKGEEGGEIDFMQLTEEGGVPAAEVARTGIDKEIIRRYMVDARQTRPGAGEKGRPRDAVHRQTGDKKLLEGAAVEFGEPVDTRYLEITVVGALIPGKIGVKPESGEIRQLLTVAVDTEHRAHELTDKIVLHRHGALHADIVGFAHFLAVYIDDIVPLAAVGVSLAPGAHLAEICRGGP